MNYFSFNVYDVFLDGCWDKVGSGVISGGGRSIPIAYWLFTWQYWPVPFLRPRESVQAGSSHVQTNCSPTSSEGLNWEQNLYPAAPILLGSWLLFPPFFFSFLFLLTLNHSKEGRFKSTFKIYKRKKGLLNKHNLTAIFFLSSEGSCWRLTFPLSVSQCILNVGNQSEMYYWFRRIHVQLLF